ncbi:MAG TPA: HAD family hydrolase [Candidatus Methanofastidiosa archaeon]|nr:HAD family hydrolase [Candidatus Methanofastidiosa archaeon]HPR41026.1 HAD family hydrolase [Candidatus Methanofastidiosa archaeon]
MDTVIFDLDDTLANTWQASGKANKRLLCFFVRRGMFRLIKAMIFRKNEEFIASNMDILLKDSYQVIEMFIRRFYPDIDASIIENAIESFDREFYRYFTLTDGASDALEYLKGRYRLCIVTDGSEWDQKRKIEHLGIEGYFDKIVIAGAVGTAKPESNNFKMALSGDEKNVYVVGDRLETDIVGGRDIGATTILFKNGFFNYKRQSEITPDHTIGRLSELRDIL